MELATTTELLLGVSYGLTQLMGESLREAGYFDFYKGYYNDRHNFHLTDPLSEIAVPKGLNAFLVRPAWQIEWGAKWLSRKRELAKGDVRKALLFWNGGGNPNYPDEVLARIPKIKRSLAP